MVAIVLFAIANVAEEFLPKAVSRSGLARKVRGGARYLSYRNFRIGFLDRNSAPLGLLLLAAVGLIYFLCMTLVPQPYYWPNTPTVDYGDQPPIATRSGWLSIACLPFVFATAGKSNMITGITSISHEKLQIFHRWISYAFFVTALVHTVPFIVYHISIGDMVDQWNTQIYYWTGTIAIIAQAWLTFASFGPLRTWCYEWFKSSHFAAALIFMIFLFFHCDGEFSAWDYFVATGVLFSVSWLHRHIKIYFEHGFGHKAELRLESSQSTELPTLRVILATREAETTQWYEEVVREMKGGHGLEKASQLAQVDIFYTGTEQNFERPSLAQRGSSMTPSDDTSLTKAIEAKEVIQPVDSSSSASSSKSPQLVDIRHQTSRPDLSGMLNDEAASLGSGIQLGVYVCGPLSIQADVANAVAAQQLRTMKDGKKDIYLHMEHFAWA
ncbi:hypothetical protein PRZ48_008914 [Zasmidium cellare]|uniref:FAD-binding FR-type domain-containing protein n=1 Tax=Zasmidium cellare TaxID=395010 RepID=A0ABR0EGV2_ZASCE|nr:hypothetical protein PRZ48_008914 [Zasmidium cellare]